MKKFLLSIAFLLFIVSGLQAQYIVTKVNGRVKRANGSYVAPGTQLTDNDQLTWSSAKDNLWVVIIGKGEKIITPAPSAAGSSLLTQLLINSVHQSSKSGSLSGRGEIIEKMPDALHTNPNSNGKIVIEQENKFLFDPKLYPQNSNSQFFVQIDVPGQSPIIRKLKANGDTLLINYTDLLTETTGPRVTYTLGYHNPTASNPSQIVSAFVPYFDMTNEVDDLLANTLTAYKTTGLARDAVRDSVYQNIYAASGKPNGIMFTNVFNAYWANNRTAPRRDSSATGAGFNQAAFLQVPKLSGSVTVTRDELPANFSLRQYAPPVGYQGQFQSCAAWSTAYAARTIAYAVQHNYSINNHYELIKNNSFAPDFIYNNIRTTADCVTPTYMEDAMKFMTKKGNIVKLSDVFNCGTTYDNTALAVAQDYRIKDFIRVNDVVNNKAALTQRMKALIVSKHALPFGMFFPSSMFHIPPSGVWNPVDADRVSLTNARNGAAPYVGHAMCVIGYDDGINGGSFEVMNSWGVGAGNKGFYWLNYNDFCDFVSEVYAMNDFETAPPVVAAKVDVPKASPVIPQAVKPEPVLIKPIASTTTKKIEIPQVVEPAPKPALKGDMEFMLLKNDNTEESVAVTKSMVNTRGQFIAADQDASAFANFMLAKPFYSGDKYKIRFSLGQPAYVYVLGMDKESNYNLFPQEKLHESAWININNATLYLPNDSTHYALDNVAGKEKMCVLVSKSSIDIAALNQQFATGDHNLYGAIRKFLPKRLIEIKNGSYLNNKIAFNTPVGDDDVLAFFIEIDHKDKQ